MCVLYISGLDHSSRQPSPIPSSWWTYGLTKLAYIPGIYSGREHILTRTTSRTSIILCWKQCCPLRPENVTVTKSATNSCLHDLRWHTGVVDICTLVLNLLLLPLWWKCPNPNLQWKSAFIGQCCPKQFLIFFNILGACFEICKHIR